MMASSSIRQTASKSPIRELPSLENCPPDADVVANRTKPGRDRRDEWRRRTIPLNSKAAVMKMHHIATFTPGSGIAIGLVMLALSSSPSLAQTHPWLHTRPGSICDEECATILAEQTPVRRWRLPNRSVRLQWG